MGNIYIKAYGYKGSDITQQLWTETAEISVFDAVTGITTVTGRTHTLVGVINNLTTLTIEEVGAGTVVTREELEGLYVSAISINDGPKIYSHNENGTPVFTKPVEGSGNDTLTFSEESGIALESGDTLYVYHLAEEDVESEDGIPEKEIATRWLAGAIAMEAEIDNAPNVAIYSLMRGLGATLE